MFMEILSERWAELFFLIALDVFAISVFYVLHQKGKLKQFKLLALGVVSSSTLIIFLVGITDVSSNSERRSLNVTHTPAQQQDTSLMTSQNLAPERSNAKDSKARLKELIEEQKSETLPDSN